MEPSIEKYLNLIRREDGLLLDGLLGLGALCYYGLGIYNNIVTIEKAVIWPRYVKNINHSMHTYLAGSIGFTALSTLEVNRTLLMNMIRGSWVTTGATFEAILEVECWYNQYYMTRAQDPKQLA